MTGGAHDTLFEARARLRQRIEDGLRSPYPVEHMMGIADSWADERADTQVAADRKRLVEAIRTEAARYTDPEPEERAYRDGLRLAISMIARGQA